MVISAELESEVSQLLVAAGDGEKLVAVVQQVMSLLEKNKHVHKLVFLLPWPCVASVYTELDP